ncbi:MAG: hypothetical protein IJM44_03460 [Ruminococcus sp.]|nr:hypothetical protein [Ruminococcus sp.]
MRRLFALLCAAGLITLTGCSSGRVNDKYYLRSVTITGNSDVSLNMDFFAEELRLTDVSGSSPQDARRHAELLCGRDIFTGYTELVVLGDCNSRAALEAMLRDWRVSPSCLVVYCSAPDELADTLSAEELTGIVREAVRQGLAPECGLVSVLSGLLHGGADVPEICAEGFSGVKQIV